MATYGAEPTAKPTAEPTRYVCTECGCTSYETGQIHVSGGFWSSLVDVGNKR